MKKLYLVDGFSYLFRSYFAIKGMTNSEGMSTNALYGFIRSIENILTDFSPGMLCIVFDGPNNKERRLEIYSEYKKNREKMPEDLFQQLKLAKLYCKAKGLPYLCEEGVEADDVIGAVAKWGFRNEYETYILSTDKDLCQLINEKTFMINTYKNNLVVDRKQVHSLYGVFPEQIIDYLAIMGDKADNIPGIPGFGPKTAASLLSQFGSIDILFDKIDTVKNKKQAKKIAEHKKELLISRKLAQLILDINIPKDAKFYTPCAKDNQALKKLYSDMKFNTLLTKLYESSQGKTTPINASTPKTSYVMIESLDALKDLLSRLSRKPLVCIDTETDKLCPITGKLVGIGLGYEPFSSYYIPFNHCFEPQIIISYLKPFLENPKTFFIGHNIKYDLHILRNHGIHIKTVGFDTMIASHLLSPNKNRHSLDSLCVEYFDKIKTPISDLIGTGKNEISMSEVPPEKVSLYCCEDVDYTLRLKSIFSPLLENSPAMEIFTSIELPLINVLIEMERFGIYLQSEKLSDISSRLRNDLLKLEKDIYQLADESFNIKSPKQLSYILYDKLGINIGSKKKTTRADLLESLKSDHPVVEKVLAYRALEKLRSTYTDALPKQINKKTNRIHCNFVQTATATGRLACKDPNLQNIPIRSSIGKKIRCAFTPNEEDKVFLSADYSQIELRLLAHLSQDPKLINAFNIGEDIHTTTASEVFGVEKNNVTKEMRSNAKAVNFGILYGQQAYGLSQELGIDIKKASDFIKKYFEKYPGVQNYIQSSINNAHEFGYAKTMYGRQRPLPEINNKNNLIRAAAERLAINTPLQGSQADIIKLAMIKIDQFLEKEPLGHLILQIHDELIFELPKRNIEPLRNKVREIMENITQLSIPLVVNITVGKNWGEC